MSRNRVTEFGGIAGRVVMDSMSPGTLASGLTLGLVLAVGAWFFHRFGMGLAEIAFTQLVLALAYARFALNGLHGDWRGTLFSSSGGTWGDALPVAGRYLLLNGIWISPLLLLGRSPARALDEIRAVAVGMPGGTALDLIALYIVGMALLPPVFLILAVSARSLRELFSPDHAGTLFGGRLGDLALIYVLYLGALTGVLLFSAPPLILIGVHRILAALVLAGMLAAFLGGLAVTLLGKLCGFYAFGEGEDGTEEPMRRPVPSGTSAPATTLLRAAPARAEAVPPSIARMAPLIDAAVRIESAWRRFQQDPSGAIAALEEVRTSHAPHPHVAHTLCLMLRHTGREEEALERAREALPLCFERGHLAHACEIFRELRPHAAELGLTREETLAVGHALLKTSDLRDAEVAFTAVLKTDAGEKRAVKGLLQVAEADLGPHGSPEAAARVYRFLLERCGASPLAEAMHNGLAEAERRLARA